MQIKKYILLYPLLIIIVCGNLFSQTVDTLATVQVYNVALIKPDSLSFDLKITRTSDKWERFANGTFQLIFNDTTLISPAKINIDYLGGTSDLKIASLAGNNLPVTEYIITPRVFDGRISITLAGPEFFVDAFPVMRDSSIKIGTFIITPKDTAVLPKGLKWLTPSFYYQACAYKIDKDTFWIPDVLMAGPNDNFEMAHPGTSEVNYVVGELPAPEMILKYFKVEYAGRKKVKISWATIKEAYNKGFILQRALMNYNVVDTTTDVQWNEIARWSGGRPQEAGMRGAGTSFKEHEYLYEYDTVQYRGSDYCYRLYYQDFNDRELYLAMKCLPVPNAVIVAATPYPNPFTNSTRIDYRVDDDVMMTTTVYDLKGREIRKLIDNKEIKYGRHDLIFEASDLASQGMYDMIFIAYPIDDPSVEVSRAIVKLQLIR
ncbi:MAG: hypothetical protein WCT77_09770 [Bacteroidota bacterium]